MSNYKVKVRNEAESKEVQELLFHLGYEKDACSLGNYPAVIVTTQDWATGNYCSTRALGLDIPAHEDYKEITLPQLRAMAEPKMKEYLIPDRNYEYILTDAREGLEPHAKDWIEIPEGSEFAVLNGDNEINFYAGFGLEKSHFILEFIVWQREQDEPFLTPECTLNDQYAEIEQVRQVEIHGTVKAEPDFNFGAAEASCGVDATLAERQSQYGCYEDVAHVTQQILSALRIGNYDELPAPMKESLHMIASKMARIVNGDPKYLDNWHDIGGYAKLIEKLIEGN